MKRLFCVCACVLVFAFVASAQTRYAFVDTEYILSKIPEYQVVKKQIDKVSLEWQKDLDLKYNSIDSLINKLKIDQVFLSPAMKDKREKEISIRQIELKKLEVYYFGEQGELYKKKQALLKPILDDIFEAIKEIATVGNYGAIFDRSTGLSVVYFNPRLDKSDSVLEKLGYKTN